VYGVYYSVAKRHGLSIRLASGWSAALATGVVSASGSFRERRVGITRTIGKVENLTIYATYGRAMDMAIHVGPEAWLSSKRRMLQTLSAISSDGCAFQWNTGHEPGDRSRGRKAADVSGAGRGDFLGSTDS
jgi:hypothetical protein